MTLEEAIKHAEEVAKENDDSAKEFYRVSKLETHPDRKRAEDGYVECKECADEHRQLAEWLKDYKRLREQEYCEDVISRQAVIRWVKTECNPYGKPTLDFESGKKVIEHLKQMSPVTLQPKTEEELQWFDIA